MNCAAGGAVAMAVMVDIGSREAIESRRALGKTNGLNDRSTVRGRAAPYFAVAYYYVVTAQFPDEPRDGRSPVGRLTRH